MPESCRVCLLGTFTSFQILLGKMLAKCLARHINAESQVMTCMGDSETNSSMHMGDIRDEIVGSVRGPGKNASASCTVR